MKNLSAAFIYLVFISVAQAQDSPVITYMNPSSLQAGRELPPECWSKSVRCQGSRFTELHARFEITGKNLGDVVLTTDVIPAGRLRFEKVKFNKKGTRVTGQIIVSPETGAGNVQVILKGAGGEASVPLEIWVSATQYLKRAFADDKRIEVEGSWLFRIPNTLATDIAQQLNEGLKHVSSNSYQELHAVYKIYDRKTWNVFESQATGEEGRLAAFVQNCQKKIPIFAGKKTVKNLAKTVLHETAHLLHCQHVKALGVAPQEVNKAFFSSSKTAGSFQQKWIEAAGDLSKCAFFPLTSKGAWAKAGGATAPLCGFYSAYGASDSVMGSRHFTEDVATMATAAVFDPHFFEKPEVGREYKEVYEKKITLLREYGFIP